MKSSFSVALLRNPNSVTLHCIVLQAPSTHIRIFLKTHLFLSVLGWRPHGDTIFGHQKRRFSKTLSRVDLSENAVFMLSCGCVTTELFENTDVTAPIYDVSEHAQGSLEMTQGHFDCLFSFVKVRTEVRFRPAMGSEGKYPIISNVSFQGKVLVFGHLMEERGFVLRKDLALSEGCIEKRVLCLPDTI